MNKTAGHNHRLVLLVMFGVTAFICAATIFLGARVYQDFLEVSSLRADVSADKAKEGAFLKLKDLAENTNANYEKLTGFVITNDTLVKFIDLVEEVGHKSGAATSVVSANELGGVTEEKEVLAGWRLDLRLEGSFVEVWQGLQMIEALPAAKKVVEIKLVRLSPAGAVPVHWGGGIVIEVPTIK